MPKDTCGIDKSCVWVASSKLRSKGMKVSPGDLCIGITNGGEPCGARAVYRFTRPFYDEWDDGHDWSTPFPFCAIHGKGIMEAVMHHLNSRPAMAEIAQQALDEKAKEERRQRADRERKHGHVYFLRIGDRVKIGFSTDPDRRIRNLETQGGSRADEVVTRRGSRALEAKLHRQFEHLRLDGEWFTMDDGIRQMMDMLSS